MCWRRGGGCRPPDGSSPTASAGSRPPTPAARESLQGEYGLILSLFSEMYVYYSRSHFQENPEPYRTDCSMYSCTSVFSHN